MAAENDVKSEPVADSPTSVLEDEVFSIEFLFSNFCFVKLFFRVTFSLLGC